MNHWCGHFTFFQWARRIVQRRRKNLKKQKQSVQEKAAEQKGVDYVRVVEKLQDKITKLEVELQAAMEASGSDNEDAVETLMQRISKKEIAMKFAKTNHWKWRKENLAHKIMKEVESIEAYGGQIVETIGKVALLIMCGVRSVSWIFRVVGSDDLVLGLDILPRLCIAISSYSFVILAKWQVDK